jgi:hypothetical protein
MEVERKLSVRRLQLLRLRVAGDTEDFEIVAFGHVAELSVFSNPFSVLFHLRLMTDNR